jgi:glycosyltransferase involved in cell wall biosynthesis
VQVSVAIICHNYGHYLAEAVDSVLAQTLLLCEIVVVDDASTDNTEAVARGYAARGVRYVRVDTGNVWLNRTRIINELRGKWVLCLDADNTLPPTYLQRAVDIGDSDPACGIVWPMLNRFGDDDRLIEFDNPLPLTSANHIDAAAVYRREAITQTPLDDVEIDCLKSAEDWLLARRVTAAGWRALRNEVPVNYRVHGHQKHTRRLANTRAYYDDAALHLEPVTIVVPISGRNATWPMVRDWLERQTWPRHLCRVHLIDSTQSDEWRQTLREWYAATDYRDVRITEDTTGRQGLADAPRAGHMMTNRDVNRVVAGIYNRAINEATTEFIFTLEDDVVPHRLNAIDQLFRGMNQRVAGVTGAYPHRDRKKWLAWRGTAERHDYPHAMGEGIVDIDGCGFGCFLLRRSAFGGLRLTSDGPTIFFDCNASDTIKAMGWKLKLNWSVTCDHHAAPL